MTTEDGRPKPRPSSGETDSLDPILFGEEVLEKAKSISQRTREKMRKVLPDDTAIEILALNSDDTDLNHPALPSE